MHGPDPGSDSSRMPSISPLPVLLPAPDTYPELLRAFRIPADHANRLDRPPRMAIPRKLTSDSPFKVPTESPAKCPLCLRGFPLPSERSDATVIELKESLSHGLVAEAVGILRDPLRHFQFRTSARVQGELKLLFALQLQTAS